MNSIRFRSGLGTALPQLQPFFTLLPPFIPIHHSYQLFIVFASLFLLSAFLLS